MTCSEIHGCVLDGTGPGLSSQSRPGLACYNVTSDLESRNVELLQTHKLGTRLTGEIGSNTWIRNQSSQNTVRHWSYIVLCLFNEPAFLKWASAVIIVILVIIPGPDYRVLAVSGRPIVQHAGYLEHFDKRLNIDDRASRYKNPHVFRIGVSGPDRAGYWWRGIWECIYNRHRRTHEGASFVWYRYQGTPGQGERPWWNVESVAGRNNNMEMGGHTTSQTSPHTPEYWEYCTLSKHPRLSGSDLWFCKQSAGRVWFGGITDAISSRPALPSS